MSYDYDYSMQSDGAEILLAFLGMIMGVLLVVGIIGLICYIFKSIGLHRLANRRGIKHGWLAWLPIGSDWVLGSIADDYQNVAHGKNTKRRFILLVLSVIAMAINANTGGNALKLLGEFMEAAGDLSDPAFQGAYWQMQQGALMALFTAGVSIALFVFQCIALYDLYSSCNPDHNVLFMVLGIIFGILKPFFIFACRNKDGGMPPRRKVNPESGTQEPWGEL